MGWWVDGSMGWWSDGWFALRRRLATERRTGIKNIQGKSKTGVLDVLGLSVAPRVYLGSPGGPFRGLGGLRGEPRRVIGGPGEVPGELRGGL